MRMRATTASTSASPPITSSVRTRQVTPASLNNSVVHLKGNVVIRACCMQHGLQQTQPRQAMFMRGQEAVYHGDTGEIEFNGNVKVSFS